MKDCFVTFRSVTPAQRAQSLLRRRGIGAELQRTPKWMEEKGCGYSLRLHRTEAVAAVAALDAQGIAYRKVYLSNGEEAFEEMTL